MENTHSCIPVEYLKIIEEQREKTERTREMILRYERRRIINEYFTESESETDDSDNDRARSRRNSWGSKENGRKEVESSNEEEESRQEFESRKEKEEEAEEAEEEEAEEAEEAEEEEAEEAEEEEEEAEGAEEEEEKTPGLDDLQAHRCLQKYLKKLQAAQATREWVIKSDL